MAPPLCTAWSRVVSSSDVSGRRDALNGKIGLVSAHVYGGGISQVPWERPKIQTDQLAADNLVTDY